MNICFVHAHPDDETLASGALITHFVQEGHDVSVLTATRGEMGEVVPGPLTVLAGTPALQTRREQELTGALAELGVQGPLFLGTAPARAAGLPDRRYMDSGMRWVTEHVAGPAEHADGRSLCAARPAEAVADIVAHLRHHNATLAISYDADGGYGHPDHVACHHLTRQAAKELGIGFAAISPEPSPGVRWYELESLLPAVIAALRHHETQLTVRGGAIIHSGGQPDVARASVGLKGDAAVLPS